MEKDTLELTRGSLFLEKIDQAFAGADADLLKKACAFSNDRDDGSGPESLRAAELLLAHDADAVTVATALLAPLLWRGFTDRDEIRASFGQGVAAAIEDLNVTFTAHDDTRRYDRRDVHALLASMGAVPRKALLLIVFRLLALEDAGPSPGNDTRRAAREVLDLYVPIADRLGLGDLRRRLEDASFRVLDMKEYEHLKKQVEPIQAEDDRCLQLLLIGVRRLLDNNGIKGRVQGRTKSLYGIRCKMIRTGGSLEEIMDRIGLRVIVASVPECYAVLGLLHSHFTPVPGTFDDYIGLPKENGYQSLHTCVYPVREISHKPIEFQVRTELMHKEAEHGSAAHWRYKDDAGSAGRNHDRVQWIRGLVHQHKRAESAEEFIERLHRQVFQGTLVVFGKRGRITRLAKKATVRDYLSMTNMRVTGGMVVKVNGKVVSVDLRLRDGDSVEVCDREGAPLPNTEEGGKAAARGPREIDSKDTAATHLP